MSGNCDDLELISNQRTGSMLDDSIRSLVIYRTAHRQIQDG